MSAIIRYCTLFRLQRTPYEFFLRNSLFQYVTYCSHSDSKASESKDFDRRLQDLLVCPLSKEPLRFVRGKIESILVLLELEDNYRYDGKTNELICDKLNVAYPIVNGIPNLVPSDARIIKEDTTT